MFCVNIRYLIDDKYVLITNYKVIRRLFWLTDKHVLTVDSLKSLVNITESVSLDSITDHNNKQTFGLGYLDHLIVITATALVTTGNGWAWQ